MFIIPLSYVIPTIAMQDRGNTEPLPPNKRDIRYTFLGQFWRHKDGIFSRVTLRTVAFYHIMLRDFRVNFDSEAVREAKHVFD